MTVTGDYKTYERTGPRGLESPCHRSRGLPGADQHGTPADRCRNLPCDRLTGISRSERSVE